MLSVALQSSQSSLELACYDTSDIFSSSSEIPVKPTAIHSVVPGYSFRARILPPTEKDTVVVCTESVPGETPRLSRHVIVFGDKHYPRSSLCIRTQDVNPPLPISKFGYTSASVLDQGCHRALVVQKVFT